MARREYRASFKCAEPGCRDTQFFAVSTRADENRLYADQHRNPYRCTRHRNPEQNLRPGNESTTSVLVACRVKSGFPDIPLYNTDPDWPYLKGLFWRREGQESGGSGFVFGEGFNAHASDVPEGTRLVITAIIEMPDERIADASDATVAV